MFVESPVAGGGGGRRGDPAYAELVAARFAWEDLRRDPGRLAELVVARNRLERARTRVRGVASLGWA